MSLARGEIYLVAPPPGRDPKKARALVINGDQVVLVSKSSLTHYVGSLSPKTIGALRDALRVALGVD